MDAQFDRETLVRQLQGLYADLSKHSVYQSLPPFIEEALGLRFDIDPLWRGDSVRLQHILQHANTAKWQLDCASWCDFGANTGFFSLSIAHQMPHAKVLAVEANSNHAAFIAALRDAFSLNRLLVLSQNVGRGGLEELGRHSVLLHLNVLHHAGFDFDRDDVKGIADFSLYAHEYLRRLTLNAHHLVFQMGSNLWGQKTLPIVAFDDEPAKIKLYAKWLIDAGWRIEDIAYATRVSPLAEGDKPSVGYRSLPSALVPQCSDWAAKDDLLTFLESLRLHEHPGEFYRRPLFICSAS